MSWAVFNSIPLQHSFPPWLSDGWWRKGWPSLTHFSSRQRNLLTLWATSHGAHQVSSYSLIVFSWKIFWNAEYRLALRNIMESPSDKCEGFDNSLRRIKQLKHHISKLSQRMEPNLPQQTKVEVITIRQQSNVWSGNYKHKTGILNCLSYHCEHCEHHYMYLILVGTKQTPRNKLRFDYK